MAGPKHALTDEARGIIRDHKEAMILALTGFPDAYSVTSASGPADMPPKQADAAEAAVARPAALSGHDCSGCANLQMRDEAVQGTRRRWWWRCRSGFALLEARWYGQRVLSAPAECDQFRPWSPGSP
jgi:hypothetical protein